MSQIVLTRYIPMSNFVENFVPTKSCSAYVLEDAGCVFSAELQALLKSLARARVGALHGKLPPSLRLA